MASVIKIKRSSVPSKVPTISDIATGELAINTKDRKIYSSNGTAVFSFTSDYLQVANAVATYTTKAYAAANSYVKSILANTNLAITNVKTGLTSTNTALRTLISDRLQVANASSIYQTKAVERAALANTNTFIATKVSTTTFNSALANTNLAITNVKTGLTTTNTAIRTLISDRLQVANAAVIYQTKAVERSALANTNSRITLVNTNLTGTNTAIRTLVSDRLQVANAVAIYQTKAVERSALANTNTFIATKVNTTTFNSALANTNLAITNVKTGLTTTNTAIRTLISDRLQVANAVTIYATKSNPTTSGLLAHTGRATISTNLNVSGNTVIGKLVANGSLGTSGYALKSNGSTVYWDAVGAAITNDTLTSSDVYPAFLGATSGIATTLFTSNAKLLYKPSTGELKASELVASNGLIVNKNSITSNYTIESGYNAMSVGPITVSGGVAVTVTSGQRWLVM